MTLHGVRVWASHLPVLSGIAAVTWLPVYLVLSAASVALEVSSNMTAVITSIRNGHSPDVLAVYAIAGYALMALLVTLIAVLLSHGALIAAIASIERRSRVDIRDCYRVAARRILPFLGVIALLTGLIVLGETALYLVGLTIVELAGSSVLFLTVMLFAASLLPLFIAAPFIVAPQAAVLEEASVMRALQRSRALLRNRYWTALSILVFLGIIGWLAGVVLGLPVRWAGTGLRLVLVNGVAGAVGALLLAPLTMSALTSLYFAAGGTAQPAGAPVGRGAVDDAEPPADARLARSTRLKRLAIAASGLLLIAANGDNTAVAINTKNNSIDIKVAFKIVRANGDIVAPANFAVAYASCTSCETAAIAIEAVFVTSTDAGVVSPVNQAWAVNYACTNCQTLADAYQFTETTGGPVHFTPEGNKEIAQIRRQLEAIAHSDMTLPEIVVAVQELANQLQQVIATQVVPAGQPDQNAAPSPAGSPKPAQGSNAGTGPSASPSASPSPPAPSPSVSPSPSPSPTPT